MYIYTHTHNATWTNFNIVVKIYETVNSHRPVNMLKHQKETPHYG